MSILLILAYTLIRKGAPITTRTVNTWPADSTPLQISLHDTRWEEYEHEELERFTSSVLQHVRNCVDKQVQVYHDTKPWMNKKVQQLLRERGSAFRSKDMALYNIARANLNRGVKEPKAEYKGKIEDCFPSNDSRRVWQGVQHMTNFRANRLSADGDNPQLAAWKGSHPSTSWGGPCPGGPTPQPSSRRHNSVSIS